MCSVEYIFWYYAHDKLDSKDISNFWHGKVRILCSRVCRHSTRCLQNYTSYMILLSALGLGVSFRFDLWKKVCSLSFFFSRMDYLKRLPLVAWMGTMSQLLTLSNDLIYRFVWLAITAHSSWLQGSAAQIFSVQFLAQHSYVVVELLQRFMLRYRSISLPLLQSTHRLHLPSQQNSELRSYDVLLLRPFIELYQKLYFSLI